MGDYAISIEQLAKKYALQHRVDANYGYVALRDVLAHRAKQFVKSLANPFGPKRSGPAFEEFWALQDVSIEIKPGECVGIIGRNGAGKSTLLKVLSRITEPTRGRIRIRGRVASLLEVGTGFHPELTGRENTYLNGAILGMTRAEIRRKFDEIVAFAEVEQFLDTPVKRYSSGMYMRLAFSVAAHLEPEILVVDEVLAVGDAEFQKKCMGKMGEVARQGRTVFFVSHNMGAISNLCQRGIMLEKGRVKFDGPARQAVETYMVSALASGGTAAGLPHVIYEQPAARKEQAPFAITRIELRELDGTPKPLLSTGDTVALRITYYAKKTVPRGAVVLLFSGYDGSRVLFLANEPDAGFVMPLKAGEHAVECVIKKLSLAHGEFMVGAGLWEPFGDCLCWTQDLCALAVAPKDVYGGGYTVKATRSLTTTDHSWRLVD